MVRSRSVWRSGSGIKITRKDSSVRVNIKESRVEGLRMLRSGSVAIVAESALLNKEHKQYDSACYRN